MAEKLTKTALKDELTRKINWFEDSYGFNMEYNSALDMDDKGIHLPIAYGRYLALTDMRSQIENNRFINGYCA